MYLSDMFPVWDHKSYQGIGRVVHGITVLERVFGTFKEVLLQFFYFASVDFIKKKSIKRVQKFTR